MQGSVANLQIMFDRADRVDLAEGLLAYRRYQRVMLDLSDRYAVAPELVTAAFVSLSPNNDYVGNLRSTVSVLEAVKHGYPIETVNISTYGHCKIRAHAYATGAACFVSKTRGLKVLNFYYNLLQPESPEWVTVDGHVFASWVAQRLTMKEAIVRRRSVYAEIKAAVQELAARKGILPNQFQAILWFARKRWLGIKYNPQLSLFDDPTDLWRTYYPVADLKPFRRLAA